MSETLNINLKTKCTSQTYARIKYRIHLCTSAVLDLLTTELKTFCGAAK